ncbi:MAG: ABC transporter ATP-binding protein [Lachnospiraceae bacterium]|nr:ABC transporter ATP-binding protein [Lachnospiraceae bacterium]
MKELRSILKYYKPYKFLFFSDLVAATISAGIALAIPLIIRNITGNLIYLPPEEGMPVILKLGVLMLLLLIISYLCERYAVYYGHVQGTYQERDMRSELFDHLQKLSFSYYDNAKVGSILSRITTDLFDITELLHHGPENLIIYTIKMLGSFIILCTINWKLALIALAMVIIMAVVVMLTHNKFSEAYVARRAAMADMSALLEDSLSGIRVVKSFTNEDHEKENFEKVNEAHVKTKLTTYNYMSRYFASMHVLCAAITVVAVVAGSLFITDGQMTISDLVSFILYIALFTDPVNRLVDFTEMFHNGFSGYKRFREILAIEPDIVDAPDALILDANDGDVEFDDVSFHYKDTDQIVLNHVNLKVRSGEYVAVCGPSGAGKTTLSSLIPRFYDVTGGSLKVDGVDVRKIRLDSLRSHIGIVQQDVYMFGGTVIENIMYGKPDASREECIEAAKAANAHDFIMELPDGYDTYIGQRGVKLSGGQKQRISIARVFLKNPPILIFDEATSALDNESERVVQESLESLAKGRTTFVIAHRLSTIQNAPRILVMAGDGIAEDGTHDELMRKKGIYADLYSKR